VVLVTDNIFGFQKALLDLFSAELVAHGAYLFASLSATIGFMQLMDRVIDKKANSRWFKVSSYIGLTLLLLLTLYSLIRIFHYGKLVNATLQQVNDIPSNYTFKDYYDYVFKMAAQETFGLSYLPMALLISLFISILFSLVTFCTFFRNRRKDAK